MVRSLLAWAARHSGQAVVDGPRWRPQAPSQTVTGARNPSGERVRFVHSWTWDPGTFVLPSAVRDVMSGEDLAAGAELELGPWDVRVLLEV